jgi:hypothetical protein
MIIIENKLISSQLFSEHFICNLQACKGACCWEGDYGAPLDDDELPILEAIYPHVKPYLLPQSVQAIEEQGQWTHLSKIQEYATPLVDNGPCAYMTYSPDGVAQCGIEQAYLDKKIDFQKPISCHLYPIRINRNNHYEILNYDEWDICSAACTLGKQHQMPVFRFLKAPLIRKYGTDFYDQLEATFEYYQKDVS